MLARPTASGSVWTASVERPSPRPRLTLSVRRRGRSPQLTSGWRRGRGGDGYIGTILIITDFSLRYSLSTVNIDSEAGSWLRLSQTMQAQIVTLRAWKILILVFDCPQGFLYSDRSVLYCVQIFEMMRIFIALFIVHLSRNISNIAVQ